ncbi:RNA polymerase sigma factor [Polaribacter sp. Q13]|uniref:RNA polymerase sigma factor n=1 Tax=Polaribacter sp. Q13 TaxID=2806551 RepID=UPI00193B0F85|nr:sigma-70 family RNA polymerase sigma factor [Polaribacter sp. Q13]QVY66874.1 sigma-70 family RNA polymerase sigma factor [Polaribacter sp. Q13]
MDNIETIYKLHVDDLYSYGIHLGFDGGLVMDAIHNIFQKILLNKKLNYTTNTKAYLLKSLRNELFNEYRRSNKFLAYENEAEDLNFRLDINVEDLILEKESKKYLKNKIEKVLEKLTSRQREIIYFRYTQNYSYKQISEILGITIPACRNLILKALKELRKNDAGNFYLFLNYTSSKLQDN